MSGGVGKDASGVGAGDGLRLWARVGNWPFVGLIYVYRVTLSPIMGGQCRFEPTCSRYGLDAYRAYGPIRGTRLTVGRILRCHPFNKGGYDPVPIRDDRVKGQYDQGVDDHWISDDESDSSAGV